MSVPYEKGLHELGDGLFAYLQPDGGWGWSNAGLITAGGTSLLIDTLYDLHLTREMLAAMASVLDRHPLDAAVNTHANPDHCFGNELLPSTTEIYASKTTAEEIGAVPPSLLHTLKSATDLPKELSDFVAHAFGPFDFEGITVRPPSRTFEGRLELSVGDRPIELIELGPAHTGGDTVIHVPDAAVVFTGDLLFIDGTPIVWANLGNWIAACDRILELGATTLVPGHGPVTTGQGVRDVQGYLTFVRDEARKCFDAGITPEAAADEIDISAYEGWVDPERIAANVFAAYREFDPELPAKSPPELLMQMAGWLARH
jgi:glyoxylase-like metal-dependent hydrolase (beta-lactamase superfamily II)